MGLIHIEFYILCQNNDGTPNSYSTEQVALAYMGVGLTEAEEGDLFDVFVGGYLTSIGANI